MGRFCKTVKQAANAGEKEPFLLGQRRQQYQLDARLPSGRKEWLGFQVWSKFNVSGPRLFLIPGHCVLVSINTEINTTLQSAPFINDVTHLMRILAAHINLPSRRGPSKSRRQLPACISIWWWKCRKLLHPKEGKEDAQRLKTNAHVHLHSRTQTELSSLFYWVCLFIVV